MQTHFSQTTHSPSSINDVDDDADGNDIHPKSRTSWIEKSANYFEFSVNKFAENIKTIKFVLFLALTLTIPHQEGDHEELD